MACVIQGAWRGLIVLTLLGMKLEYIFKRTSLSSSTCSWFYLSFQKSKYEPMIITQTCFKYACFLEQSGSIC